MEIPPNPGGGGYKQSAQTLLTQIAASREIALEAHTCEALQRLATGAPLREADRRFFVFRPEAVAAKASPVGGAVLPVRLLHLGLVIPTLPAEIGTGTSQTVLTGVIDDLIGFANQRFRAAPTSSQRARYWIQGMPAIGSGRAAIGGEIDRARIDALLRGIAQEADVYDRLFPAPSM